jgi:hypothetical protein
VHWHGSWGWHTCTDTTHGACACPVMWCHVGVSHVASSGATESRRLLWRNWRPNRRAPRVHQSRQSRWRDSITPIRLTRLALTWIGVQPFLLLSLLSLAEVIQCCLTIATTGRLLPVTIHLQTWSSFSPRLLLSLNRVDLVLSSCIALYMDFWEI